MTPKELEEFKELLLKKRSEILENANKTFLGIISDSDRDNGKDEYDLANSAFHEGLVLRLRDRDQKLYRKIEEALLKIENGTFGICESCEEEIDINRLRARPVTTKCIRCKEIEERGERNIKKGDNTIFIKDQDDF